MPANPLLNCTVKITAKDINGNNIAKQFNNVYGMNFDYQKGMLAILDVTGEFYFPLTPLSSFTYTIVANPGGQHTIVTS
jgi:hypothetical protein